MSKLFEQLQELVTRSKCITPSIKESELTIAGDGTIKAKLDGVTVATGKDEAELISKLAQHLVSSNI